MNVGYLHLFARPTLQQGLYELATGDTGVPFPRRLVAGRSSL